MPEPSFRFIENHCQDIQRVTEAHLCFHHSSRRSARTADRLAFIQSRLLYQQQRLQARLATLQAHTGYFERQSHKLLVSFQLLADRETTDGSPSPTEQTS